MLPRQFTTQNFYSTQINDITLEEALQIHYNLNPQFEKYTEYSNPLESKVMKSHDLAHILFGCDTSLVGEMTVELWTLFANDMGFKKYFEMASNSEINRKPLEILKKIGFWRVFWVFVLNSWRILYIMFLSNQIMEKKWPFLAEDKFLQMGIGDIRKQFNIKLI